MNIDIRVEFSDQVAKKDYDNICGEIVYMAGRDECLGYQYDDIVTGGGRACSFYGYFGDEDGIAGFKKALSDYVKENFGETYSVSGDGSVSKAESGPDTSINAFFGVGKLHSDTVVFQVKPKI